MLPDALVKTLRHTWDALEPLGLPMAIFGGIAMGPWNRIRATRDADILISIGSTDPQRILDMLQAAGIICKRADPIISLGDCRLIQAWYDAPDELIEIRVDLLLADDVFLREVIDRRRSVKFPYFDREMNVVAADDLILMKLAAGRIIDRADAASLIRENRDTLDIPRMIQWAKRKKFLDELAFVWDEAFPGEALPGAGGRSSG